jgi:hypothetical protein
VPASVGLAVINRIGSEGGCDCLFCGLQSFSVFLDVLKRFPNAPNPPKRAHDPDHKPDHLSEDKE